MTALVLAEHDQTTLSPATCRAVAAAVQMGGEVRVLVAGAECMSVAEHAAKLEGVSKVLLADAPHYAHPLAERLAPLVGRLAAEYRYIVAAATSFGKDVLPRVAGMLGVPQISEIVRVEAPGRFVRPIYAGNALETVETGEPLTLVTVRGSAFAQTAQRQGATAPIERVAAADTSTLSRFVSLRSTESARPELSAARVVVSGGYGVGSKENFALIEALADRLGAAIGASRAAVDAGYVPNDLQVGQTGKVVAPELYIAVGISGAIQHLAGMKESKVIVAINKDENAPIFEIADYGLVGDLFEILPKLTARL
jgi:electron transfer flavoprotein alpha subunit